VDKLYLKQEEGGESLFQTEANYKTQIINKAEYLNTKYKKD
jgi:hypothetical protein